MAAKEKTSSRWSAWLAPILFLLAAVAAAPSAPASMTRAIETRAWEKTSSPLESRLDESLQLLKLHQQNGGVGYDSALGSPLAAENAPSSLNILNPNFEPDPVAILQNHVDAANAALTADPTLAQNFLSRAEYAQFQTPGGYALNYGKAIENSVARDIAGNPFSDSLFDHVGGPNDPDFVGRANTVADPFQFDVTTPRAVPAHVARPYGPDTYFLTYTRP